MTFDTDISTGAFYKAAGVRKMRPDDDARMKFSGALDDAVKFVTDKQLMSAELWKDFVKQFRVRSDTQDHGWRGEFWGKMMRGASFVWSYTKSQELYALLTASVNDLLSAADDKGRLSTYSREAEFSGWDVWSRKYVLLGLQYYYEICTDSALKERILACMRTQADLIVSKVGPAEEGKLPIVMTSDAWGGINSSSILEPIVRLYGLTGEERYLDLASHIIAEGGSTRGNVFRLAFEDELDPYQYPVTKAYEIMSCFDGLLEYYYATGDERSRDAVLRFANRVASSDITVVGSAGCTNELFDHAAYRQSLVPDDYIMQETCVTVTWMKLCLRLLCLTGDAAWADRFETTLYNAYLGAFNTGDHVCGYVKKVFPDAVYRSLPFDSYSGLRDDVRGKKVGGLMMMPDGDYYGCCAAIGSAGAGMIHKAAFLRGQNGPVFGMYIPGRTETLTPGGQPIAFSVKSGLPVSGSVEITVEGLREPEIFDLTLRMPGWSEKTVVSLDGSETEAAPGFIGLKHLWQNGSCVSIAFDMSARVIAPLAPEKAAAIRRGPLMLARDARLGSDPTCAVDIDCDPDGRVTLSSADPGFPALVCFAVPTKDGGSFTVVDYASAGRTWDKDSTFSCWIKTV